METYLITLSEIRKRVAVSENIDQPTLDAAILNAQEYELEPILTEDLYNRIITEVMGGSPSAAIIALQPFYKITLIWLSLAELLRAGNFVISRYGAVVKANEHSEPLTFKERLDNVEIFQSRAKKEGLKMIKFIEDNLTDYPEFKRSESEGGPISIVIVG